MALYRFHVQKISGYFDGCDFFHMHRADNEAADVLSKLGSSRQAIPPGIALEHLRKPSIKPSPESESIFIPSAEPGGDPMDIDFGSTSANPGTHLPNLRIPSDPATSAEAMAIEPMEIDEPIFPARSVPSWAQPFMDYLAEGKLPEDEVLKRQVLRRAKGFTIINGEVYHRSATTVLQRCVEPEEGREILREIHQGECG